MKSPIIAIVLSLFALSLVSAQNHMDKLIHIWGNGMPYAKSTMAVDNAGNIYLTGMFEDTVFFGSSDNFVVPLDSTDFFITKIDNSGSVAWKKIVSGMGSEWLHDIEVDREGNVFFIGDFDLSLTVDTAFVETGLAMGFSDSYLCKLDPNGKLLELNRRSENDENLLLFEIEVDGNGQVFLMGMTRDNRAFDLPINSIPENWNYFVVSLNSSFDGEWIITLADSVEMLHLEGYHLSAMKSDPQGHLFIAGNKSNSDEIFISKLNNDGTEIWTDSIHARKYDAIGEIFTDREGNAYLTGMDRGLFSKFSPSGEKLWVTMTESRIWTSVVNHDGYTIATYFSNWGTLDGYIILDPDGNIIFDYPFEDIEVEQLAMDAEGNIYYNGYFLDGIIMNGEVIDTKDGYNYVIGVLKVAEILSENHSESVNYSDKIHLYPNPVKDNITMRSSLEAPLHIEIISMGGRSVYTKEMLEEHIQIDLSSLSEGIYIVTLRSKDLVRTEKIIKL